MTFEHEIMKSDQGREVKIFFDNEDELGKTNNAILKTFQSKIG